MDREIIRTTAPSARKSGNAAVMIKDILALVLRNWYWFAISLALAFAIGFYLTVHKRPVYLRTASIMVKDNKESAGTEAMFKELGLSQTSTNLTNELLMLNSGVVVDEVVRRLQLDVDYSRDGKFYDPVMYGRDLPLQVHFLDINDQENASLTVALQADSTVTVADLRRGKEVFSDECSARLGDTIETPIGRLAIVGSPYYKEGAHCKLNVKRTGFDAQTNNVRNRISPQLRGNNSSIIDIGFRDVSPQRAEDVLNTLVTVYNEKWMQQRNRQIVSTNEFIRERLAVIERELGSVEQDISDYKSSNLILDPGSSGAMALSQANESEQQSAVLENQIHQLRMVHDYLVSNQDDSQQIPFNSGIGNGVIVQKIAEYNTLLLQRNNHLAYTSTRNPLVADLNKQLATLRASITEALNGEIALLQNQQRALQATRKQAVSRVATAPQQEKYLLSVERQQKVKEELYLFLLQKREENELSQAFTAYNTQLIEPAHGSWKPVEPVAKTIYLYALLLGLAIPAAVLALREMFKTSVQGREDLKQLTVPFAGEIPLAGGKKKWFWQKQTKATQPPQVLVAEKNRDIMNEAFRVVRSNLEFLLGFDAAHKVVMLTSLTPGSGKTFISANLSTAVGLKDKKVLAIDLDLRKGSLSSYVGSPSDGISGYLSGKKDDVQSMIVPLGKVDVLPCGTLPPNPSELLYTQRFAQLIETVREQYDYVFIDCPPVEMVADAAIINRYVDLTLFVIRAKMLERSLLPEIQQWYDEKRYTNLTIILNSTDLASGHYGYHKYGYHKYGYQKYGYAK